MQSTEAEDFLKELELGEPVEFFCSEGKLLGRALMWDAEPVLRTIRFDGPYLPHGYTHSDRRHPDAAELFRKFQAFLDDCEAQKRAIKDGTAIDLPAGRPMSVEQIEAKIKKDRGETVDLWGVGAARKSRAKPR
jgi:hypothetical protein